MSCIAPAGSRLRRALAGRVWFGLALSVSACAASPEVALEEGDLRQARERLAAAAQKGPVRAVIAGELPRANGQVSEDLVSAALSRGVPALGVTFMPQAGRAAAREPHLAVVLNPSVPPLAERVCAAPHEIPTTPVGNELRVAAAFCEAGEPIAYVGSRADLDGADQRRIERLLWRTSAALFPDPYAQTYGFNILPSWLDIQVGGSAGF